VDTAAAELLDINTQQRMAEIEQRQDIPASEATPAPGVGHTWPLHHCRVRIEMHRQRSLRQRQAGQSTPRSGSTAGGRGSARRAARPAQAR
jgi:hypothetical protein